jgi:hypothetical protein
MPPELVPIAFSNGESSNYTRFPDVEQQIREALALPADQRRVKDLKPEALLYLLRYALPTEVTLLGRWFDALANKAIRSIKRHSKGFDEKTSDLIAEDVLATFTFDVFRRDTKVQLFLEVNFATYIKQRTLNAVRRYKNVSFIVRAEESDEALVLEDPEIDRRDGFAVLSDTALCQKALGAITDRRHREALILRYVYDWPIQDADTSRPSLCRRFNVTPRQINNWLTAARKEACAAIGDDR